MEDILHQFQLEGVLISTVPLGSGHINDSYRVKNTLADAPDYLLQRINHHIFTDVDAMMRNIDLVTGHIRSRIQEEDGQQTLTIIPGIDKTLSYQDRDGNHWRMYEFLKDLQSFDLLDTADQAYEGARSYGYFLRYLDDLPAAQIFPVLPDFHNIVSRLKAFESVLRQAQQGPLAQVQKPPSAPKAQPPKGELESRVSHCKQEIDYVLSLSEEMCALQRLREAGKLPSRITHNDTKFNNIMFSADGKGRCVVDLDTVMPGIVHFDFGDGVRTGVATANEDENDLALVGVDMDLFRGFAAGYLEITRDCLSETERKTLAQSGPLLAYIMAVRFLTDYLQGDTYYKIKYPEHNLFRARNQLRMVKELLARKGDMEVVLQRV